MFSLHTRFITPFKQWTRAIFSSSCRHIKTHLQDPKDIEEMDIYQFVDDRHSTKRSKSIFCWGFSATGALGEEKYLSKYQKGGKISVLKKTVIQVPRRLRFISPKCTLYDAAAGFGYTVIAATYDGTSHILFGFGLNTDSQLGYQATQQNESLICVANPVPIHLPLDHQQTSNEVKEKVIKVSCGRCHTVCLTNYGNVFTMGNNTFGQCGRPIIENEKYFASKRIHKIDFDQNDKVVDIVCGLDHTMFLTDSGSVYSCGWGNDGQLGNGSFESVSTPTKVIGDIQGERIVSISSAGDFVLAINDKGQTFGWGNSEYGQMKMVDNSTQINTSKHLKLENKVGKAISVGAAGSMCALVNDEGIVFVWGYGILGLGPNVRERSFPTELNSNLFGKNILNTDIKITKVEAGLHHFGAINNKGELFMWGKNNLANLGTGTKYDMMFPYRISLPIFVTKLSFGIDHSIAIGRRLV